MKKIVCSLTTFAMISTALYADQVINDDLIVTFSGCIGNDCVNDETFGFDTLRLKENNLRIKFDDTSTSGGTFPYNDWQLTANDSLNGGLNYFSIDDVTNSKIPFKVEAGAPTGSLYVNSIGKIGLGTTTPGSIELSIKDGDSPTLRLEQDGSSGFTAQTWDVVGNEQNFFVRDVTNGAKLPFKIISGAPDNSIFIDGDGDVGLGTPYPAAQLDVRGTISSNDAISATYSGYTDDSAKKMLQLTVNNTNTAKKSDAGFNLHNERAGFSWTFRTFETDEAFSISKDDTGFGATKEIKITGLDSSGGMELLLGNGAKNSGGAWIDASSRALKENIETLSTEDALEAFAQLEPVKYNYKTNKSEEVLGFIAEDVPELVAINSRDGLSAMDMVALLTKVVQAKESEMAEMKEQIKQLSKMQEKLEQMEAMLTARD
jgi:cell division protein FtsB